MMDLSNVKGNVILVYVDQGVDGAALKHLVRSLKQEGHSVRRIDARGLIETDWEKSAKLLIVPGGRDCFYHTSLKGQGTQKIRVFVERGGSYLGICAGGYFGCDRIEFEKGEALEVCDERFLKFFPGVAKGPAYGSNRYSYESAKGAEAARISWAEGASHVYFNGGCYFESDNACNDFQVLSRYLDLPGAPAAILKMQYGSGRVILSGVHFEYQASLFPLEDRFLSALSPLLTQAEESRRKIFRDILTKLL
jgi:biotin--protein ligase